MIYKGNQPLQSLSTQDFSIAENKLALYPNPNNGVFKIQMQNEMTDFVVEIFDISGKAIKNYYFHSKSELDDYCDICTDKINTIEEKVSNVDIKDKDIAKLFLTVITLVAQAEANKRLAEKLIDDYFISGRINEFSK